MDFQLEIAVTSSPKLVPRERRDPGPGEVASHHTPLAQRRLSCTSRCTVVPRLCCYGCLRIQLFICEPYHHRLPLCDCKYFRWAGSRTGKDVPPGQEYLFLPWGGHWGGAFGLGGWPQPRGPFLSSSRWQAAQGTSLFQDHKAGTLHMAPRQRTQ